MSTNDENTSSRGPDDASASEQVNLQDLVLDLNFVPTWARKSQDGPNPYANREDSKSFDQRDRRPPRRDNRTGGGGGGGSGQQKFARGRPGGQRDGSRGGERNDRSQSHDANRPGNDARRGHFPAERVTLPIEVSFIPDRDRLGAVVRQLHAVRRAFPLTYIASLFLSKPEYHMLKLEAKTVRDGVPLQFFQCRESKVVFLNREQLLDYLARTKIDKHFVKAELTVEPPVGNFVCVGQCKRSGVILGPPNYHGYNERLLEVYRTHGASSMTLDQYRNNIEMVRDPAVIEKWKSECQTQVRYRPIEAAPDAEHTLTLSQVESIFLEKYAAAYVSSGSKVILPASVVGQLEDERLLTVLRMAWQREDRFPFSLMLALRPAFKRMRLSLFKAGKDETFVTAIPPKPLDAEHAIPSIRDMMAIINEHPGWNRKQLIEKLYPGKAEDDPDVVEKLSPLAWLVDKGHIIEFFNGTYATPGHLRKPGATPAEAPQPHHHPEPAPGAVSVEAPPQIDAPDASISVDENVTAEQGEGAVEPGSQSAND